MAFYQSSAWRRLSRSIKRRDNFRCQICGDREGDPYTILHAHHIIPRATGGPDSEDNLITLCDLCHAVVTKRWHKPWFPTGTDTELERNRQEFEWFLNLPKDERDGVQRALWDMWVDETRSSSLIAVMNRAKSGEDTNK